MLLFYINGSYIKSDMKANLSFSYRCVSLFFKFIFKVLYRGKIYGEDNIPANGAFILASNHVSYLDPPIIALHCHRQPVFSFARSTLFKKGIGWFFRQLNMIAVNREKGNDIQSVKRILNILSAGYPILMFPEGTRSVTGIPQRAKKGIGLFIERSSVPVVPVRIFGSFEALPKGKRFLNLKPRLSIVYGKTLYPSDFVACRSERDPLQAISDRVMQAICQIQLKG